MATTIEKSGILSRTHDFFFGTRDPVKEQLKETEKRGQGITRWAHVLAVMLLFAFSLGSLIAFCNEALNKVEIAWQHGQIDVPDVVNVIVSGLLVIGFDTAMLKAAHTIRMRGVPHLEAWFILLFSAFLESATYIYMMYVYDTPTTFITWALVGARGVGAPVIVIFLSKAAYYSIKHEDIRYQAGLSAAIGFLRETIERVNDPTLSYTDKAVIFNEAHPGSDADRAGINRLVNVIDERTRRRGIEVVNADSLPPVHQAPQIAEPEPETDDDTGYGEESPYSGPLSNASASALIGMPGDLGNALYQPLDDMIEAMGEPPSATQRHHMASSSASEKPVKKYIIDLLIKFWERKNVSFNATIRDYMAWFNDHDLFTWLEEQNEKMITNPTIYTYAQKARAYVLETQRDQEAHHSLSSANSLARS